MRCSLTSLLLILILPALALAQRQTPRNIIILIADGGGYNQMMCADYYLYGDYPKSPLASFPVQLAMSTYNGSLKLDGATCYDSKKFWTDFSYGIAGFTESAASATAMGTGYKTHNSMIGMNINSDPMTNVIEIAKAKGKSTGVVTSVPFCHATPAGFSVHVKSRMSFTSIAEQMIFSGNLDVVGGTGHPWFDENGNPLDVPYPKYIDTITFNYLKSTSTLESSWTFTDNRDHIRQLGSIDPSPSKLFMIAPVSSDLAESRSGTSVQPFDIPVKPSIPTLAEMSLAALNTLNNDSDGFLIMIEGGSIDWANHDNNLPRLIEEQKYFYNTIDSIQQWLNKKGILDETLIIVTNDHECGYLWGPGCHESIFVFPSNNGKGQLPVTQYYSTNHSNTLVPFFAKGPSSDIFYSFADEIDTVRGYYITNSEIAIAIKSLWGNTAAIFETNQHNADSTILAVTFPCPNATFQWFANDKLVSGATSKQFFVNPTVYKSPTFFSCEIRCSETKYTTKHYAFEP